MDELDELRQRKLAQMQNQRNEEQQLAKEITQLEQMVTPALSREALARFGAIKAAHPEKAVRVLVTLAQLVGRGHTAIDDEMLKKVLISLEPQRREIKIRRV